MNSKIDYVDVILRCSGCLYGFHENYTTKITRTFITSLAKEVMFSVALNCFVCCFFFIYLFIFIIVPGKISAL